MKNLIIVSCLLVGYQAMASEIICETVTQKKARISRTVDGLGQSNTYTKYLNKAVENLNKKIVGIEAEDLRINQSHHGQYIQTNVCIVTK